MTEENKQIRQRTSPWRQGSVLGSDAHQLLSDLQQHDTPDTLVVVVSHDCDLAEQSIEREPNVELIVGEKITFLEGGKTHGKSLRFLHLEFEEKSQPIRVQLYAARKRIVSKGRWFSECVPNSQINLSTENLKNLRRWLSARYDRAAYSNSFVDRMRAKDFGSKLEKKLKHATYISQVLFDVDNGKEQQLSNDEIHSLKIYLVFKAGDNPRITQNDADKLAKDIQKLFEGTFFNECSETWSDISLETCEAISEDDLRVSMARKLSEWRLEHLSHRDPEAHVMPVPI